MSVYGEVVFERFSAGAERVVANAEAEARALQHPRIGTEHLLLGIVAESGSPAGQALASCGVTLAGCRSKVAEAVPVEAGTDGDGAVELSDRAKRVLERASRLSLRLRQDDVAVEHILSSVLDVEGRAGQVLRGLSVDLGQLRDAVAAAIEDTTVEPPSGKPAGQDANALQRVVDELEIRNLLARIHHTIDRLRRGEATADDYASNWTEDCIWESASMGIYRGRDGHQRRRDEAGVLAREGGAAIPDTAADDSSAYHMTLTTEVRLDGDVAVCDSKWLYGTSRGTSGQVHQVGRYHDEVRRTPDGWKLHHRTVYP